MAGRPQQLNLKDLLQPSSTFTAALIHFHSHWVLVTLSDWSAFEVLYAGSFFVWTLCQPSESITILQVDTS